jgi:hypothetical protein
MRLTTWCGSVIDTRDRHWTIWFLWLQGWILAGWRPSAFRVRARERRAEVDRLKFSASPIVRIAGGYHISGPAQPPYRPWRAVAGALGVGLGVLLLSFVVGLGILFLSGCGVDTAREIPPFPWEAKCVTYQRYFVSVDPKDADVMPAIAPAGPLGIRIIVDDDFHPFTGSSYPVPGGRMVWNVWTFRWYDGDRLGAIGRINNTERCRWYPPHIVS